MRLDLLFVLSLAVLQGCTAHVEWRPDSSGFLYSDAKGNIRLYDLATKSSKDVARVDVAEEAFACFSTAPDGRIAVVESIAMGNETRFVTSEVRVFDEEGRVTRRATIVWDAAEDDVSERTAVPTYVRWSPNGEFLLFATQAAVGLWNAKSGRFVLDERMMPFLPIHIGTSPWRPDSAGFLAVHTDEDESDHEILFVRTDGTTRPIAFADGFFDGFSPDDLVSSGRWQGAVLTFGGGKFRMTIDTAEGTSRAAKLIAASKPREIPLGRAKLVLTESSSKVRIDWVRDGETRPLTKRRAPTLSMAGQIAVSPDGRTAVVVKSPKYLLVVDETGEIARLRVDGKTGKKKDEPE